MIRPWLLCLLLFSYSSASSDSWLPLVNLAHRFLKDTNSSFSSNCWVCLSIQTQRSLAIPAPLTTWTDSPMKLHITYSARTLSGPYPITDLEKRLLNFHPLTAYYSFVDPDRRAIALLQLTSSTHILPILSRLTSVKYTDDHVYESAQRPIWGPLSTQTLLTSQAPLCISRFFKNSEYATFVGNLSASLCNHTFHLSPSADHQSIDLSTSYAFAELMTMPGSKWRNPLRFSGPPSLTSGKPFYPCLVDDIHCHTYPTTPWRRCPSPPSSTCYNLTLFEPDNITHPLTLSVDTTYFKIKLQGHKEPYPLFQYQPLMGAALSGQYSIWEDEPTVQENGGITPNIFSYLLSLTYSFCLNSSGVFFLCGSSTYVCLPANWSGVCTLVFQYPDIELLPSNQTITVPLFATIPSSDSTSRRKRAVHLLPLLAGLGITSALGLGIAGITASTIYFRQLSQALSDSLDEVATSFTTLQDQIDSLAGLVLQNRRALDLITAEKGGTCLFLQEECCFYVNQSGVVRDAARKLRERASEFHPSSSSWIQGLGLGYWLPSWLTSFVGPILFILFLLVFGPCLLNCLTHFVSQRMSSFIQSTTKGHVDKILLLRDSQYKRLPQQPPEEDAAAV
ncbi:syncytin-A-like [Peromyscus eremicus]|uniref:syncytin-A-like n=1 Tax=Peromyscus eremicus TaxID=42410 RepID=UPI0027DE1762|nr:syncytin-A-like [Peromyscus eremicus]